MLSSEFVLSERRYELEIAPDSVEPASSSSQLARTFQPLFCFNRMYLPRGSLKPHPDI
jgi:hypothetical protein